MPTPGTPTWSLSWNISASPTMPSTDMRGPANLSIHADIDASTGRLLAYVIDGTFGGASRTIWMDGRPHPSKFAAHTWGVILHRHLGKATRSQGGNHAREGRLLAAQWHHL